MAHINYQIPGDDEIQVYVYCPKCGAWNPQCLTRIRRRTVPTWVSALGTLGIILECFLEPFPELFALLFGGVAHDNQHLLLEYRCKKCSHVFTYDSNVLVDNPLGYKKRDANKGGATLDPTISRWPYSG